MRRETAAAYCDMSVEQFDRQCPVPAKDQGWRGLRWDRAALDSWIDNLPDKPRREGQGGLDAPTKPESDAPAATTAEERRAASLARA